MQYRIQKKAKECGMPSVLLEYGFYTNLEDLCVLRCYRDKLVEATMSGIKKYFEIIQK